MSNQNTGSAPYVLPPLPYADNALDPVFQQKLAATTLDNFDLF